MNKYKVNQQIKKIIKKEVENKVKNLEHKLDKMFEYFYFKNKDILSTFYINKNDKKDFIF